MMLLMDKGRTFDSKSNASSVRWQSRCSGGGRAEAHLSIVATANGGRGVRDSAWW